MALVHLSACVVAICLALIVLWEIFETIVLPRRIDRRFRATRYYYLSAWGVWCLVLDKLLGPKRRSAFLAIFGPLSLLGLFLLWAVLLIFAFGLLHWSTHPLFKMPEGETASFALDLYVSGTTITTLGLGDVTPLSRFARLITIVQAGLGLSLVALVVSYLPTLYQAFSRREVQISLLDARAGSPPSAVELLLRSAQRNQLDGLDRLLADWERWCAEIMESHISYPVLCYFRSQHTNQNWVAATTAILDTCALSVACSEHPSSAQAYLTFAIARHAVVDITQIFHKEPASDIPERLSRELFRSLCQQLAQSPFKLKSDDESWRKLAEMRALYEPYLFTLSRHLRMDLSPWVHPPGVKDSWLATRWAGRRRQTEH